MIRIRTILAAAVVVGPALLGPVAPAFAAPGGACLSEPQIEAAIASGQIQSWARVRQMANIPNNYREKSDVRVCMRGGVPYYVVTLASPKGDYFKEALNAVDGSS
jgi:hypothetical protein